MRKSLYPRLAWQNVRNNRRFFVPFLLAIVGNVAAFYIMAALSLDAGVKNMTPGHESGYLYVKFMMAMGMFIAFVFSAIFLLYVNSFLMKQRKRELGVYNILGLGKGHIAVVLLLETLMVGGGGILGGLALGALFQRLVTLILFRALSFDVPFGVTVSWPAVFITAGLFAGLILLTLLINLNRVRVSKPIELLQGGSVGEREPKTRWFMTILGVVTLGAGYIIAISASNGVEALLWYFVAVFLVIVGTYCLFTAVSIFVLKALRRNKRFYYRTGHFIGVSGMLYRMKQNAVGLANICILSTMVMVMLSGTLSLYLGSEEILDQQTPGDINVTVRYLPDEADPFMPDIMLDKQVRFIQSQGVKVEDTWTTSELGFGAGRLGDGSYTTDRFRMGTEGSVVMVTAMTERAYTDVTGETLGLAQGEVAAYGVEGDTFTVHWDVPDGAAGETVDYPIARHLKSNPSVSPMIAQLVTIVVPDQAALNDIFYHQAEAYGESSSQLRWTAHINVDTGAQEIMALEEAYWDAVDTGVVDYDGTGEWRSLSWQNRPVAEQNIYGLAGGFLFLGIFLAFIFLMATVLIIYYKQISEGYEDKERFEIMQKVGLSREEVKSSIRSQVLMVFFLPIAVAAVHILFDFNMVEKLLTMFMLQNTTLTALCTLGTVLVFFLVYGAVYLLTARTYYKIVERKP